MANIIGEPLASYVYNQIKTRQKIHGSGTPNNPRTPEYISYLNSKTAWVKMASGVLVTKDRLLSETDSAGKSISYSGYEWDGLAKNFILFSGVSHLIDGKLTPRGTYEGANNIYDWDKGTYNINPFTTSNDVTGEFGLAPMPGIESVDVKCLNRGSTKNVSVKVKCYTPEQFKIIDLLYLRIGYTMFIEWGWAPYMEDSETLVHDYSTLIEQSENQGFLHHSYWKNKSYIDFSKRIEKVRAKHRGNYDGLLCKVTNFSWTFTQDGSYDIDIQLISLGDVVESLKTNITPSYKTSKDITTAYKLFNDDYSQEESQDSPPSPVNNIISAYFFLQKLITYQNGQDGNNKYWIERQIPIKVNGESLDLCSIFVKDPNSKLEPFSQIEYVEFDDDGGTDFTQWLKENYSNATRVTNLDTATSPGTYYTVNDESSITVKSIIDLNSLDTQNQQKSDIVYFNYNNQEDDEDKVNDEGFYIRFGHLLDFLKERVIPRIDGTSHPMGEAPILDIDSGQWSNKMYTFPYQVSLDPRVCIVHTKEKVNSKEYYTSLPVWKNEKKGYAYPMNIYLSFNKINDIISSNLDDKGNLALFDFLSSICTEINKALGGLNNLEPIIDEVTNTLKIIDGSYSPKFNKPEYALELFGYNSNNPVQANTTVSNFVRDFSIKTEITNDFATMATVGSTAGGYVKGTENTMFSKWNKGLIDRFKQELIPADKNSRKKEGETPEPNVMYVEEFWNKKYSAFGLTIPIDIPNDIWTGDQPSLLPEMIDRNISVVTEFYKYCQSEIQKKKEKYASPSNGFVPISLNLTIDGLSGIKIYNALNVVTRVLPSNYPNALKFIVKGVNHKISDNDWETTIETVVISQNEDNKKEILSYQEIYDIVKNIIGNGTRESAAQNNNSQNNSAPQNNNIPRNNLKSKNPSGYGDTVGACGTPEKYNISNIKYNDKVNPIQAKKLLDRILNKVVKDIEGGSHSICAAYVKRIAKKYFEYYNKPEVNISNIPSWKQSSVGVGGLHAKNKSTHDWLVNSFGYTRIILGKNLTQPEAKSLINSVKYNIGDIISYWDHSDDTQGKQKYGHIQMYVGGEGKQWVSDFRHNSFVYSSKTGCWDVIYLQAPNKKEPKIVS